MFRGIAFAVITMLVSAALVSAQDEPGAAAEALPAPLRVWLPAPLIDDESSAAYQMLADHTARFAENNDIPVQFRIKDIGKLGGIMATIRAGSEVAPGALPDIALIRRRDFTATQALQYLQSMETLFSTSLINDLADGLAFGQVEQDGSAALFGMPYLFDLLLAVSTQPLTADGAGLRFDDVLKNEISFRFPAARTNGLNQTFYLQYLAAGGSLPENGALSLDDAALEAVLSFYEALTQRRLVATDVLTFQSSADYRNDFLSEPAQSQLAVFTASDYLTVFEQSETALYAANIPTSGGESASVRDGWLWVMATPDLSRQALSARFLEWMMEPGFHAQFAMALYHLPSQPAILTDSLPEFVDRQLFADLLASAIRPLPETEGGSAPRLMQEAMAQVLQGEQDAASATRRVMDQVAER